MPRASATAMAPASTRSRLSGTRSSSSRLAFGAIPHPFPLGAGPVDGLILLTYRTKYVVLSTTDGKGPRLRGRGPTRSREDADAVPTLARQSQSTGLQPHRDPPRRPAGVGPRREIIG